MKNILNYDEFIQQMRETVKAYDRLQRKLQQMLEDSDPVDPGLFEPNRSYSGKEILAIVEESKKKKEVSEASLPKGHIQNFLEAFIQL